MVVVTDHKPLVKIFGDRTLDETSNTRLFRLKQRTLMWRFDITHLPGTTYSAANATSRHPAEYDSIARISLANYDSPDMIEAAFVAAVQQGTSDNLCLQWSEIARETATDLGLKELLLAIQADFWSDFSDTSRVRLHLPFRDGYCDGVILYHDYVVVPLSLRRKVLSFLHEAHQGESAMERRARSIAFCPGMTNNIHAVRDSYVHCNRDAPPKTATPPILSNSPATPFEKFFTDYFDYRVRHFLVNGDRFFVRQMCLARHLERMLLGHLH